MSSFKHDNFNDRLSTQAAARKAQIEKFKARPAPDDPAVLAKRAELVAIAEARKARIEERRLAREAEAARLAKEAAELAAQRAAEDVARQREEAEMAARRLAADADSKARAQALAAEQKAARDARYAARQSRRK